MKLFHLSHLDDPEVTLQPRVPHRLLKNENKTAKRICTAPSIEQALLGYWGCDPEHKPPVIPLIEEVTPAWTIDTRPPGGRFLYRVYCVDADPIKPRKVPDAQYTGELWLMEETTMYLEGQISVYNRIQTEKPPLTYWYWSPYGDEAYAKHKKAFLTEPPVLSKLK